MATATPTLKRKAAPTTGRASVVIEDRVTVPSWVRDLDSFRRWVKSDELPESGRFSFDGEIWVDLSREQLFTHSRVKLEYTTVLRLIEQAIDRGYLFPDGVLLSHAGAKLSTEPDAMFVAFESIHEGRVRLIRGATGGYVEVEGSPDMSLEIISRASERKDTEILRELYWRAHVTEYWLVDARSDVQFDILRWTSKGYRRTTPVRGWLRSTVFDRWFQLTQDTDPLGNPQFRLLVRQEAPGK